jgi:hypothetical protein
MWSTSPTAHSVQAIDVTPLDNQTGTYTFNTGNTTKWSGKQTGEVQPNGCSVISCKTAFRGPSTRGRLFLGPIAEVAITNGMIVQASRTELVSSWQAFQIAMIARSMQHVVASYVHGTALTVISYSVRPAGGTMRRRQDRIAG